VVNADGEDVPVGEPGELLFRSPTFMHGYWNQPELTAKTLQGGWLHSGDVGRVDAQGNIYILDRVKDMIVANGFNVFPKEVENAIAAHPAVLTVAVVGVPDELRGEDIFAFVVRRAGACASSEDIADHCTRHLARYKLPRYISLADELPLTATGKIRRFKLREIAIAEIASGCALRVNANKTTVSDRSAG
jgi:long-chain acyl-CoA synthetase